MAWSKSTRITIMLVIDVMFFLLELTVGLVVGSLALMADAFHMLNDIISLLVGLWAVKAAQKSSTDKYSFGWLRAEILGAFFNAVFLIALCVSIVLEAITRLVDPPEISNPMLILIVGSLGLASNLVGFLVLGGHGHSHGPGEEAHDHDHSHGVKDAEEGHGHFHHSQVDGTTLADEDGVPGEVFPETVVARHKSPRQVDFNESGTTLQSEGSNVSKKHQRRRSSIKRNNLRNIEGLSLHPASFRQDIIAASKRDGGADAEEDSVDDGHSHVASLNENSPLLKKKSSHSHGTGNDHDHEHDGEHEHEHHHDDTNQSDRIRHDSWHANHNHKKPQKENQGSGGHNHADMGMRAMILHVAGDALGNVGVIVAALVIMLTDSPYRFYSDPAVSLFITLIILHSTIPLTVATAKILLQATPDHLDVNDIKEDIQGIPGVVSCHHVHIWQLSDSQVIASMHIQVSFPLESGSERYMELARHARECLHAYGIHSATIQPEFCLDENHNHSLVQNTDGARDTDTDSCLLECVDDCNAKGCCGPVSEAHSANDGHVH